MEIFVTLVCVIVFILFPIMYIWRVQARVTKPVEIKRAGVMLIIKDGLILAISRRHNKEIFGLLGGKLDIEAGDQNAMDTAIREAFEEANINVKEACFIYERMELGDGFNQVDFCSSTYYALNWEGEPQSSEEGVVKWLTVKELTSTHAAFGDYNRNMLDSFKLQFPDVKLIGEENN